VGSFDCRISSRKTTGRYERRLLSDGESLAMLVIARDVMRLLKLFYGRNLLLTDAFRLDIGYFLADFNVYLYYMYI
jgi:hypothetical protein